MKATRTEFGNIQLFDSRSGALKIVAQHGFDAEFLDFFRDVRDDGAACGTAMRARQRVVVEDVLTSPIFLGSLAQDIPLRARVWAVQSTPLVTACGQLVGMMSTHFRSRHRAAAYQLRLIDIIGRQTARLMLDGRLEPNREQNGAACDALERAD